MVVALRNALTSDLQNALTLKTLTRPLERQLLTVSRSSDVVQDVLRVMFREADRVHGRRSVARRDLYRVARQAVADVAAIDQMIEKKSAR
jgi:hypothetical protein